MQLPLKGMASINRNATYTDRNGFYLKKWLLVKIFLTKRNTFHSNGWLPLKGATSSKKNGFHLKTFSSTKISFSRMTGLYWFLLHGFLLLPINWVQKSRTVLFSIQNLYQRQKLKFFSSSLMMFKNFSLSFRDFCE